jgi:hypothetical protein
MTIVTRERIGMTQSSDKPRKDRNGGKQGGLGAILSARIAASTKALLESEAAKTGRTVSQIADLWLQQAAILNNMGQTGRSVSEAIAAMVAFSQRIEEEGLGDPGKELAARDALHAGWHRLVDISIPYTPDTEEGRRVRERQLVVRKLCSVAQLAVASEAAESIARAEAVRDVGRPTLTRLFHGNDGAQPEVFTEYVDLTLAQLLGRVSLTPGDRRLSQDLYSRARQAGKQIENLAPAMEPLVKSIEDLHAVTDAYMATRKDAAERGRLLAESFADIPPLPRAV